jgi:hypothetical protein
LNASMDGYHVEMGSYRWVGYGTFVLFVLFTAAAFQASQYWAAGVEGVNVYRSLHKFSWNDVVEASPRSVLGFRYLRLKRARGMAVWLPLYLVSHRKLDVALRDWVPEGNPIKRCI